MEDNYNLDMDSMIEQIDESQESVDLVKIGNTFYTIHNDIAGAEIENIASYLNSDIPDDIKIYKDAVEPDNSTEPNNETKQKSKRESEERILVFLIRSLTSTTLQQR